MSKQEKEVIKRVFKGYKKMNRAMRSILEEYNLIIISEGKHYKIRRADSIGGCCILAKSCSDYRAGANFSCYLIKLIEADDYFSLD